MLKKTTVALCLLTVLVCVGQAQDDSDKSKMKPKPSPVVVTIAKKDAEGNIVENPKQITPKDAPLFCYIDLNEPKPTLIQIQVLNKKVKGLRPNSKFVTLKYKTKQEDGGATFTLKPKDKWATGTYLIKVFLDGNEVESREFVVSVKKAKTS